MASLKPHFCHEVGVMQAALEEREVKRWLAPCSLDTAEPRFESRPLESGLGVFSVITTAL